MLTSCLTAITPGSVSSQFPPCSAARSTITEPGFMDLTMSAVISLGAGLPGMSAVVMMMSTSLACSANNSISALMNSSLITLAYPPPPEPSSSNSISRNSAPILSTCCLTSSLVSKARTMAPMLRAAPMAASPATPAPMTITFAGGTLPAAVIWPVKKRPKLFAASTTAR